MFARLFVACSVVSLCCASVAFADDDTVSEDVVVTASRFPIEADQSGSALSLIDGQTLEARQITTVFDALREVPGVAVSQSGSLGSLSEIRVRGGEANHTLVLIDGVEANDPAASSEFNFAHLLSPAIDRVEVLRGPQSALWGADAVTGVVNVVTVAPQEGVFARGAAEGGSFDTKEISGLFNAGTGSYGVVLDAAYLRTGGINIAQTGSEKDGYVNLSLGGRAFWQVTPEIKLSASLHHLNATTDTDATDPLGAVSIPIDTGDFTKVNMTYGRAEASGSWFGGVLQTIAGASITRTESRDYTSQDFPPDLNDVAFNDSVDGGKTKFDFQSNIVWEGWGAQQRLSLLAETARETFSQLRLDLPSADQSEAERDSGVAGEYWVGIDNAVFLSFGGRHDWNQRFADSTTWRTTLSALLPDGFARLHASAGTGVKNPDFFELFGFVPDTFTGNPALTPERSLGFDAGVETNAFDKRLKFDVTYFHADLENEIFTDFSVFPETARNETGRSLRQGVEVSAHAALSEGLSLDGTYTYTESTAEGAEELRRPKDMASLDLDYHFAGERAFVGIGADFQGSQKDTEFLNVAPFSLPVTLHSYTLVRVSGSYDIGNGMALTGRVENALDQHYEDVFGYRTRGIGFFAGLAAKTGS